MQGWTETFLVPIPGAVGRSSDPSWGWFGGVAGGFWGSVDFGAPHAQGCGCRVPCSGFGVMLTPDPGLGWLLREAEGWGWQLLVEMGPRAAPQPGFAFLDPSPVPVLWDLTLP